MLDAIGCWGLLPFRLDRGCWSRKPHSLCYGQLHRFIMYDLLTRWVTTFTDKRTTHPLSKKMPVKHLDGCMYAASISVRAAVYVVPRPAPWRGACDQSYCVEHRKSSSFLIRSILHNIMSLCLALLDNKPDSSLYRTHGRWIKTTRAYDEERTWVSSITSNDKRSGSTARRAILQVPALCKHSKTIFSPAFIPTRSAQS